MIKLLGLDMDGTVLNTDIEVSHENANAIKQAIEKGIIVVPTTGRALGMVPREILNLPGVNYAITSNGAAIFDTRTKEVIYEKPISKEQLEQIFDVLKDYNTFDEIIIDGRSYALKDQFDRLPEFVEEEYWDLYENLMTPLSKELFDEAIESNNIEKIAFRFPLNDESDKKEIFARIREIPGIGILSQAEGTQEITSLEANKGEALAHIANRYGIDCSQVMAVGDSENDIPMLTFANTGVAMGQAKDHVKEHANYITDSNDQHGVAKAIERFILNQEYTEDDIPKELVEKVKEVSREITQ